MVVDWQVAVAFATLIIGAVVWLIRLEGRVNLIDRLVNNLVVELRDVIRELRSEVRYVRDRIDDAIERRHKPRE